MWVHCRQCYPKDRSLTEKQYGDLKTACDRMQIQFPEASIEDKKKIAETGKLPEAFEAAIVEAEQGLKKEIKARCLCST